MVCARNKDKEEFNEERVKALGTPIAGIKSLNSDKMAAVASTNKAGNLPNKIFLAKGCDVLLTENLWPQAGLCNGSRGTDRMR